MDSRVYLSLLWRRVWLILLGMAVAGGVAWLVSQKTAPLYRASSRLLIDEASGSAGDSDYSLFLLEQRLAQTYVAIINTHPVREETIERLGLPFSADELATMLSVTALPDTKIIVISVEDVDPVRAAEISNTIGKVFIAQNQARESLRYAAPIANWEVRIDKIGGEIEALETEINAAGKSETAADLAALSRLETQLGEARIRYTEAFSNLNELRVAQAKESSTLVEVEPALPPVTPIRPRSVFNTVLAAVAGGMVTAGIIFFHERLDDTIKTPEQVLKETNLITLGTIAVIKGDNLPSRLVVTALPTDPNTEAYRVLRTNLGYTTSNSTCGAILITSSLPGEGKSTTAANLAVVLAQSGKRVILVDADLRRPIQHLVFEVPNHQGLTTTILDSQSTIDEHLQATKVPNLAILTSGPIPPNPAEFLDSSRLVQTLVALSQKADWVLLDTPPTLNAADVSILAPLVGRCLLIVEVNRTPRAALVQTVERLQRVNVNVVGIVMNRFRPGRGSYAYYYTRNNTSKNPHPLQNLR